MGIIQREYLDAPSSDADSEDAHSLESANEQARSSPTSSGYVWPASTAGHLSFPIPTPRYTPTPTNPAANNLSSSPASSSSASSSPTGSPYRGEHRILVCSECGTHLSLQSNVISKSFQGHHGRAWLFSKVVNVLTGPPSERTMTTGPHVVCDILCKGCCVILGWKYIHAMESSQRYKEGKFIMERNLLSELA